MKKLLIDNKNVKIKKIWHPCDGYFPHYHRNAFVADTCTFIQLLLPMAKIHHAYLRRFNPFKLKKIELAMRGKNLRAMRRRISKGQSAI